MSVNTCFKIIAVNIVRARKRVSCSQEELAIICNIDRTYYSRIEAGKANPSIRILKKISRGLNTSVSRLTRNV